MSNLQQIQERMKSDKPLKFLFAGDSITHGASHTDGWRDYTEIFSERLRTELGRGRDFVIKTGISGWTTRKVREDLEWNILQFDADIVSIMLGMNDCATTHELSVSEFHDNYNYIIDQIQQRNNALIMLHTTNPIWDMAKDLRGDLPQYTEAIREIADKRGLLLIDHDAYWAEQLEETPWNLYFWMSDCLHPNHHGHVVFARNMFKTLDIWDPNTRTGKYYCP